MGDIHSSAVPHMESAKSLYVVCETAVLFVVMLVVSCHGCVGPSPRSRGSARPKTASSLILRGHV